MFKDVKEAKKELLEWLDGQGKGLEEQLEDGDAFDVMCDIAASCADNEIETPDYYHNMNLLEKAVKELEREYLNN